MISYESGGVWFVLKLFQMRGSVFPASFLVALPCGGAAALLKACIEMGYIPMFSDPESVIADTQAWSGFSFLVGFLVVFRTSQAYNRFWDGCTATHAMRAEWFDACSALVAFCKHSSVDDKHIVEFKNTLIRLFSMLHSAALAELEELNHDVEDIEGITSFGFDLIDPEGIDEESLRAVKGSSSKVELLFSWIQFLIVENITSGVLSIPPPILSRAFQEIANGMVAFHDAVKITYIPFPFPYAQTCDLLLVMHWLVVPFVTAHWVTKPFWAFIFVVIQVFILWSLNFIAVEIENPFGTDANDLDGHHMQNEMNRHLLLLLRPETIRTPRLVEGASKVHLQHIGEEVEIKSFKEVWRQIDDVAPALPARKDLRFTRAFAEVKLESQMGSIDGSEVQAAKAGMLGRFSRSVSASSMPPDDIDRLSEMSPPVFQSSAPVADSRKSYKERPLAPGARSTKMTRSVDSSASSDAQHGSGDYSPRLEAHSPRSIREQRAIVTGGREESSEEREVILTPGHRPQKKVQIAPTASFPCPRSDSDAAPTADSAEVAEGADALRHPANAAKDGRGKTPNGQGHCGSPTDDCDISRPPASPPSSLQPSTFMAADLRLHRKEPSGD